MKRKLLSLALALTLCLGLMAVPASAASANVVKTFGEEVEPAFNYRVWSDGMLAAEKDYLFDSAASGYIFLDRNGNEIPGALFQDARDFSEGLAAAAPKAKDSDSKGYGYVDKTGKMVIEPQFETAGQFHDGVARVKDRDTGKWGIIDKNGNVVIPFEYDSNNNGPYVHEVSDGLIAAYKSADGYWGYFDTTGRVAIPFQYANAYDFENGYAKVRLGQRETYIDKSGRDIIPQQYEYITRITVDGEPVALFSAKDTTATGRNAYYLLNGSGQVVCGPYDSFGRGGYNQEFSNGLMPATRYEGSNALFGFVNTAGQEVIPCGQFQSITYSDYRSAFVDGYAMVKTQDGAYAIINTAGQITATLSQDLRFGIGNWAEGFLPVSSDASGRSRFGFINASGQLVVDYKYSSVRSFSNGVAAVANFDGQWGLINTAGVEIAPCKYTSISDFINGVAVVSMVHHKGSLGNVYGYGLINTAGQEILPCKYDEGISSIDSGSIGALKDSLQKGGQEVCAILKNLDTGLYDFVRITTDYAAPTTPETPVTPVQPVTPTVGNFTDVAATSPFKDAILWAVDQGITNGTSGTTFSPSATCTVRQILTFLYRAAGRPGAAEGQSDLDAAVAWAVREGLLAEGADSAAACTRSMAVEFMWKAAGSPAPTQSASFSDVSADADYADAVAWAVEKGITNGTGGGAFSPDNTCTRGQIVTFLYRNK